MWNTSCIEAEMIIYWEKLIEYVTCYLRWKFKTAYVEFSMEYKTHKPVPPYDVDKIVEKFQKQQVAVKTTKKGDAFDM